MELKLTLIARRIKNTDVNLTDYGDIWDTVIYGADDDLTKTIRKIQFVMQIGSPFIHIPDTVSSKRQCPVFQCICSTNM